MSKNILIVFIILLLLVLGYFFISGTVQNDVDEDVEEDVIPVEMIDALEVVEIRGFLFIPQNITVVSGTTVRWINEDGVPHTVNSNVFDSPVLSTGDSYDFEFIEPGTYEYICGLHPEMTGTIIVE